MTFALTADGITVDSVDEIRDRMAAKARAPGGIDPNLDTSDNDPIGRAFGVLAVELAAVQRVVRDVGVSIGPTASGRALRNSALLTGTRPRDPSYSTVSASVQLTAGTTLDAGSRANVAGDTSAIFETLEDVTNGSGITATFAVDMRAITSGPVRAPAGLLTVINTPVAGWVSVTNAFDATEGQADETDPELRLRREEELNVSGSTVVLAIVADVNEVDGVLDTASAENLTNATDGNGLPPHSFEIIVWDGVAEAASDDAIAQAILDAQPAGIEAAHGSGGTSESGNAVDDEETTHAVAFTRASAKDAYIDVAVTVDADKYPVDGDDQIKSALAEAFNADQKIGIEAIITKYYALVYAIGGVLEASMTLGASASPTGIRLAVARAEIAVADTARITVTVT